MARDLFSSKGGKTRGGWRPSNVSFSPLDAMVNWHCALIHSILPNRTDCSFVPSALSIALETSLDLIIFHSSRTIIRIRCLRFIASSFEHNVCKGSRQNGSVRSQERVAHDDGKAGVYEQASLQRTWDEGLSFRKEV